MMTTSRLTTVVRILIAVGAMWVLGTLGQAIRAKEQIKRDGEIVYLELAPVDPRSLIQGDYMALRFALARELQQREDSGRPALRDGEIAAAAVTLDARRVAHLAPNGTAATLALRYRLRNHQVWLGTNAYFFEEGTADRYSGARYGAFRVDRASGEAVLVGLCDAQLNAL